ncbi:DMT family transporter [Streptomyces kebangsaanensis]|uniref:DMT family transporter n=1 Tax=Streptomyces kebangsaanensis TaxID=864058 RepID=A0ABW6L0B5_9ACTN
MLGEQQTGGGGPHPAAVVLGVFCTAVTFHLTYRIVNDEGATNAAAVGYLLPVVSVLLGAVVLGENLSARVVLGMVVVLVGVGMTRRNGAAEGTSATADAPAARRASLENTRRPPVSPGRGRRTAS